MGFIPVDINSIKLDAPENTEQSNNSMRFIPVDINSIKLDAPEQQNTEEFPQEPDFFQRVGQDMQNRWGMTKDIAAKPFTNPAYGIAPAMLNVVGKGGYGLASDIVGEGIKSVGTGIKNITPDSVINAGADVGNYLGDTDTAAWLVDKAKAIGEGYNNLIGGTPIGDLADSAANVINVVGTGKASNEAGELIGKGGKSLTQKALERELADKKAFVKDLNMPKQTPKVANETLSNSTTSGLNETPNYIPSKYEQSVIDTVATLPVKKGNNLLSNYNIIKNANIAEAESLKASLANNKVVIPQEFIDKSLSRAYTNLADNMYIVGDGKVAADNVLQAANKIIQNNPKTAAGLLQSRKELDELVTRQRGEKAFNPSLDSPVSMAVKEVRQSINDMIAKVAPESEVKSSLQKQNHMFTAMDNIKTKLASTPITKIDRLKASVEGVLPTTLAGKAAVLGAGATAYATSPAVLGVTAAGYLAYKGGKALINPALKAAGFTLDKTGLLLRGGKPLTMNELDSLPHGQVKQLLLPSPDKMTPIPMSEQQIKSAQRQMNKKPPMPSANDTKVTVSNAMGDLPIIPMASNEPKILALPAPGKATPIPMSDFEILKAQKLSNIPPVSGADLSGASVRPLESQKLKIESSADWITGAQFKNMQNALLNRELSQNEFVKKAQKAFNLSPTKARNLAIEIKTNAKHFSQGGHVLKKLKAVQGTKKSAPLMFPKHIVDKNRDAFFDGKKPRTVEQAYKLLGGT